MFKHSVAAAERAAPAAVVLVVVAARQAVLPAGVMRAVVPVVPQDSRAE